MLTNQQKNKIEKFVESKLDVLNWMHVSRVRPIAAYIAKKEKADPEIVDVSVLFHDIAKTNLKRELYHHVEGAKIAKKFLTELGLDEDFIDAVYHCVIAHSTPLKYFRSKAKDDADVFLPAPKTIEAKVVFDADMVQQLSPYGITKSFFINSTVYKKPFQESFLATKSTLMKDAANALFTKTGKDLAKTRLKYLKDFFHKLENE